MSTSNFNLDTILIEIGQLGKFQLINYMLICFSIVLSACFTLSYVFTAGDLHYRCLIPECGDNGKEYRPPWLVNAVPFMNNEPSQCQRYQYQRNISSSDGGGDVCSSVNDFSQKKIINCEQFVYEDERKTIVNEVSSDLKRFNSS